MTLETRPRVHRRRRAGRGDPDGRSGCASGSSPSTIGGGRPGARRTSRGRASPADRAPLTEPPARLGPPARLPPGSAPTGLPAASRPCSAWRHTRPACPPPARPCSAWRHTRPACPAPARPCSAWRHTRPACPPQPALAPPGGTPYARARASPPVGSARRHGNAPDQRTTIPPPLGRRAAARAAKVGRVSSGRSSTSPVRIVPSADRLARVSETSKTSWPCGSSRTLSWRRLIRAWASASRVSASTRTRQRSGGGPISSASQARRSPSIGSGTSAAHRIPGWRRSRNRSSSDACA